MRLTNLVNATFSHSNYECTAPPNVSNVSFANISTKLMACIKSSNAVMARDPGSSAAVEATDIGETGT